METTQSKRNGEIDILKFLFACFIMLGHYRSYYSNPNRFVNGYLGVEFFFIVSGFLMALNAERHQKTENIFNESWKFIINKIKSFFRYFLVATIMVVLFDLLTYLKNGYPIGDFLRSFVKAIPSVTLTSMGLDYEQRVFYVPASWYLSAMLIGMFILYPILLKKYEFCSKYLCPLIALFGYGFLWNRDQGFNVPVSWLGFCFAEIILALAGLAFGVAMAQLSKQVNRISSIRVKRFLVVVKYLCFAIALGHCLTGTKGMDLSITLTMGIMVCLSFSNLGINLKGNKITDFLGKFSLAIYLFHLTLQKAIVRFYPSLSVFNSKLSFVLFMLAILAVCLVLMFLTDFVVSLIKKKRVASIK